MVLHFALYIFSFLSPVVLFAAQEPNAPSIKMLHVFIQADVNEVHFENIWVFQRRTLNRPWQVSIDLPDEMKRAMAKQAEAERERRAKVIHAQGEFQAAEKLAEAAKRIAVEPIALQLRYLQTLSEVATENNSTTLFPIPIDLLKPFMPKLGEGSK